MDLFKVELMFVIVVEGSVMVEEGSRMMAKVSGMAGRGWAAQL